MAPGSPHVARATDGQAHLPTPYIALAFTIGCFVVCALVIVAIFYTRRRWRGQVCGRRQGARCSPRAVVCGWGHAMRRAIGRGDQYGSASNGRSDLENAVVSDEKSGNAASSDSCTPRSSSTATLADPVQTKDFVACSLSDEKPLDSPVTSRLGELDIADARELGPLDTIDCAIAQLAADMSLQLPSIIDIPPVSKRK